MSEIILINPKYGHNVAGALRACSAFGVNRLWVTGSRVRDELSKAGKTRLPREERMKAYKDVEVIYHDYPFDHAKGRVTGVEVMDTAMPLPWYEHPEEAVYVFGPEDGGIDKATRRHCHDFVIIPSDHCLNLACAVNVVLYDRRVKRQLAGFEAVQPAYATLNEQRGWISTDEII